MIVRYTCWNVGNIIFFFYLGCYVLASTFGQLNIIMLEKHNIEQNEWGEKGHDKWL